jgi:predicted permease
MASRLYGLLLRLLPRHRRLGYGDEMAAVFAEVVGEARRQAGWLGAGAAWMKELFGLARFSISARGLTAGPRSHLDRPELPGSGRGRWHMTSEIKGAWRGVRGRGWSAVLSVGLIALALAANTLVFSATDALVFNTLPYREADRLVTLNMSSSPRLHQLRSFSDLFSAVHGYLAGSTFVTGRVEPTYVSTTFVTPGLFEMLGIAPRFGRGFVDADMAATDSPAAVIDHDLARERYGDPRAAVGQTLETTDRPLLVVGVMPPGFRFPEGRTRIWRVLDYARYSGGRVIISGFSGFWPVARLAAGVPLEHVERTVIERIPELTPSGNRSAVNPIRFGRPPDERRLMLFALLGAALCLLLTACANVTSVELAGALRRSRAYAIQAALGAPRGTLVRTALFEGALLVALAIALAAVLAVAGLEILTSRLPERITQGGINPIDLDWRSAVFMAGGAVATWGIASLPVVVSSARSNLIDALKLEDRAAAASRARTVTRRLLTVGQVAFAVVLLVGGLLYARTYTRLLAIETGADTTGVASISLTLPPETFPTPERIDELATGIMGRLKSHPGVKAVTRLYGPAPPAVGFAMRSHPEIDSRPATPAELSALIYNVEPDFFATLGLPLRLGRIFGPDDPPTSAIVSDTMARQFWSGENPIGRTFRIDPSYPVCTVVGVVGHVRNDRDTLTGPTESSFTFYLPPQPPLRRANRPGDSTGPPPVNVPAASLWASVTFLARLADPAQLGAVLGTLRGTDSRFQTKAEFLDDAYASRHAETLMATSIVTAFAGFAFIVAMTGIYGVMAFLVAGRTREIGIRMALGADRRSISRMVLGSSARLVLWGAALGSGAALLTSRWIESQLFGVSPTDPATYVAVSAAIVATALLATWHPAHQAARVDPAITLRTE